MTDIQTKPLVKGKLLRGLSFTKHLTNPTSSADLHFALLPQLSAVATAFINRFCSAVVCRRHLFSPAIDVVNIFFNSSSNAAADKKRGHSLSDFFTHGSEDVWLSFNILSISSFQRCFHCLEPFLCFCPIVQ